MGDFLNLTKEALSIDEINKKLISKSCGAVSLFVGTTRDNFENKTVDRLEYECYEEMAMKVLQEICKEIRKSYSNVENIAIYHRLGEVPVGEISVIIGTSSPHREDAIKATSFCIDAVKSRVPIWKKEFYSNETTDEPRIIRKIDIDPNLVQINVTNNEINQRIKRFMEHKREMLNMTNILDFVASDQNSSNSNENIINRESCARVEAVLTRRKDSKSHLKIRKVFNQTGPQIKLDFQKPKNVYDNPVEERLQNAEEHLFLKKPIGADIYKRIKQIEDRILQIESLSPEYQQFWKNLPFYNNEEITKKKRKINLLELEERLNFLKQEDSN